MCERPREVGRPAGLTQLQEEVLVVYPERGSYGTVGGDGRQVTMKGEGHWEDRPLQYMGDNC